MSDPALQWSTVSASVRGSTHVQKDTPNEDSVGTRQTSGLTLIAVADGHGSEQAPRSAIGSRLAVQAALDVAAMMAPSVGVAGPDVDERLRVDMGGTIVSRWRDSVAAHLAGQPFSADELQLLGDLPADYAYGSTILLAGCTAQIGFALQLGDGHIVLVDTTRTGGLAFAEEGRVATETYSLCMSNAERFVRARTWSIDGTHPRIIAASSDGWGDAFVDRQWFVGVGKQLHEHVRDRGVDHIRNELNGWLERPAAEFGDDTTMALLIEESGATTAPIITPPPIVASPPVAPPLPPTDVPAATPTAEPEPTNPGPTNPGSADPGPISRTATRTAPGWGMVAGVVVLALVIGGIAGWLLQGGPTSAAPTLWTELGQIRVSGDRAELTRPGVPGMGPTTVIADDLIVRIVDGTLFLNDVGTDVDNATQISIELAPISAIAMDGDRLLAAATTGSFVYVIDATSCERLCVDTIVCLVVDAGSAGAGEVDGVVGGCPSPSQSTTTQPTDTSQPNTSQPNTSQPNTSTTQPADSTVTTVRVPQQLNPNATTTEG